jgi:hypothetical protein
MESSTAQSDEDKAKEEKKKSVDISKTRRRIEDALRKSDADTIIKIAETLGVTLAEQLPETLEIVLADVWKELERTSSYIWKLPNATAIQADLALDNLQNNILDSLPSRFSTYFLIYAYEQTCWSRMSRHFFTKEATEKHRKPGETVRVNHFNVIQMRMTIDDVQRQIREKSSGAYPLEPDEKEQLKYLRRTLYQYIEKTDLKSRAGEII